MQAACVLAHHYALLRWAHRVEVACGGGDGGGAICSCF